MTSSVQRVIETARQVAAEAKDDAAYLRAESERGWVAVSLTSAHQLITALDGLEEAPTAEAILAAFAAERKACADWLNATDAPNAALLEWDARRETYAQLMAAYVTANHTTIAKAERALGIVYTR